MSLEEHLGVTTPPQRAYLDGLGDSNPILVTCVLNLCFLWVRRVATHTTTRTRAATNTTGNIVPMMMPCTATTMEPGAKDTRVGRTVVVGGRFVSGVARIGEEAAGRVESEGTSCTVVDVGTDEINPCGGRKDRKIQYTYMVCTECVFNGLT